MFSRALIFCFISFAHLALAQTTIIGKVVGVADADTITVLDAGKTQHKIRLEGIDAPERGQAYGAKATEALKAALGDGSVKVLVSGKDRYGRSIGKVYAGKTSINSWLVANGWAWHYKAYSKDKILAELETKARAAKVGLWADSRAPQAPWEYRVSKRAPKPPQGELENQAGQWWLNTGSNVRHNSGCRYFRNTSKGRPCGTKEGKACGICGG